ncbi:hypothetical protein IV49_GL002075 [Kandleria vitulina DSM 20405]|uniref:Uncharacterized protein n=1 Tax=Kandleria vitulina DSM 20405 TaxID=1410657 RepID=A0A0R2HDA6_9FIRM|nr:hypothetical protein [Kandleria vitulina]KRN50427.1 hypothetical protein IV49_GL002075 [Kandleria vitulina DSM 20405]
MEKNIYYYELVVKKKKDKSEIALNNNEIYQMFEDIYNHTRSVDVYKTCELDGLYYYDFMIFNQEEMFLKIGKANMNNAIEIRDKDTFKSGPINIKENQQLNTILYFYMDFNTCIATICSSEGIGYGTAVKKLLIDKYKKDITNVSFANILSKDIIKTIMKKDIISNIEFSYAVPSDEILSSIHLNRDVFNDIQNKKSMQMTCKLCIDRNKSAFDDNRRVLTVFNDITSKYKLLKSFHIDAKNKGEKKERFNLLEYRYKDKIEYNEHDFSKYKTMYELIKSKYSNKKYEICELIQNT